MKMIRIMTGFAAVAVAAATVVHSNERPLGKGDESTQTSEQELTEWYTGESAASSKRNTTQSASFGSQEDPPEDPTPAKAQEEVPPNPMGGGHSIPQQNEVPPEPLPPRETEPASDPDVTQPPPTPTEPFSTQAPEPIAPGEPARLSPAAPATTDATMPAATAPAASPPGSCGSQSGGYCGPQPFPIAQSYQPANVASAPCNTPCNTSCLSATLCDRPCQDWTVFTGALFLSRNRPDGLQMFVDPGGRLLDANNFDFGSQSGVEIAATRHRAAGDADFEVRYFGVNDWDSLQSRRFEGNPIRINNSTPTFVSGPRRLISTYSSELQNFEWNFITPNGNGTSYVFGFRHIQLDEQLLTRFRSTLTPPISTEDYRINTENRLYGLQAGLNRTLIGDCMSCVEFYGRAGLYLNDAQQRSALINYLTPVRTFANRERDTQLAFVNEVGLRAKLKIADNANFVAGYRGMWVRNAALASDQIPNTSFAGGSNLNNSSDAFFHGGTFGIEFRF